MSFPTVRILLDEAGFTDLVAGRVVARQGRDQDGVLIRVEVALQDIGFERIRAIADEADMAAAETPVTANTGRRDHGFCYHGCPHDSGCTQEDTKPAPGAA